MAGINNYKIFIYFSLLLSGVFFANLSLSQATLTSVQNGNWGTNSTWDCNCTPGITDNVVINHTVLLNNKNNTINDITINSGGTVDHGTNAMLVVNGNYVNNGREISSNAPANSLTFAGLNATVDGAGVISIKGIVEFTADHTILSSASLTRTNAPLDIASGVTVTNQGSITVIDLEGVNATSTWVNDANSTLNVSGVLLANGTLTASASGNTVNYFASSADQDIKISSSNTYYNLKTSGSTIKRIQSVTTILGNLNNSTQLETGGFNISVEGNLSNSGTITTGGETFIFNGSADQTITAGSSTFDNIQVNKSSGNLILSSNIQVLTALTMSQGNILTGNYTLTLGNNSFQGTLNHTSGRIIGHYEKWIGTTGAFLFPIGTLSEYRPATITVNALSVTGSLISTFTSSSPGTDGLPLQDGADSVFNAFTEGYWSLTGANSINVTNYDLELIGNGFSSLTANEATRLLVRSSSASPWTVEGTHVSVAGVTVQRTGMSTLSAEYAFGDTTNCDAPVTSAISGRDSVCLNETGVNYSVVNEIASTYSWSVTGGTVASGQGTNSITVDWGATGGNGNVQVIETNDCAAGAAVNYPVNIHTLATSDISGKTAVPENANGEVYAVTARPGYSYNWTVSGGSIISGQGTESITVDWGTQGSGQVCVDASSTCGAAPTKCLNINIYIVINSIATGAWDATSTWDCGCAPSSSDNVRIQNTHTITLPTSFKGSITNFIIDAGGTFNDNGKNFEVTGDITIDGTYTGSGNLTISGVDAVIDGVGNVTSSGSIIFSGGNKVVQTGANFTKSVGNVVLNSNVTVTNQGTMIIASNLNGTDATSTWANDVNSTLTIGGVLLSTGTLNATAAGNTVRYNGTSQSVKMTTYYNVINSPTSTTDLTANFDVNGDLTIAGTFNTNGHNINIAGDFTNNSGSFNAGAGTVIFDGSSTQIITNATGESFNNVTVNAGSTVNVPSGTTITINGTLTNNSTIDNDGIVNFATGYISQPGTLSGNGTHNITGGNWNLTGTFTAENSTVVFNGGSAQTIDGSTRFRNLTINNINGVSVNTGSQELTGTLTLTSGNFNTNNDFTLISNASGTGRIAEITGGSITGNISAQRFVDNGSTTSDWRSFSPPVTGGTLQQWDNADLITTGYPGSDYPTFGFKSVYYYNEADTGNLNNGWYTPSTNPHTLTVGQGYDIYIGSGSIPLTIAATGNTTIGPVALPVTYNVSTGPTDDGWNYVGNPLPSEIDWDAPGITKTNIENKYWTWNPAAGNYASWDGVTGVNGATGIIASSQGFWIHATAASPALVLPETAKSTGGSFLRNVSSSAELLKLKVTSSINGYYDETVIHLQDNAATAFKADFDTYKLLRSNYKAPRLSTYSSDSVQLAINSFALNDSVVSVPLKLFSNYTGTYTLSVSQFNISYGCIVMEDLFTGKTVQLKEDSSYSFTFYDTTSVARFRLHFNNAPSGETIDLTCNQSGNGQAIFTGKGQGPWDYIWKDSNENVISSRSGINSQDSITGLAAGQYSIVVTSALCEAEPVIFNISQPDSLEINEKVIPASCYGSKNGGVKLSATGGTLPYSYNWNSGENTKNLSNKPAGTYQVTILDSNKCLLTKSIEVTQPDSIAILSSFSDAKCYGDSTGYIDISVSGGIAPYQFEWSNGHLTEDLNNLPAGNYFVYVLDTNLCKDSMSVSIAEPDEIKSDPIISHVSCYGSTDGSINLNASGGISPLSYQWSNQVTTANISGLSSGAYTVNIIDSNNCKAISNYTISQPDSIQLMAQITDVTCTGLSNGNIDITVNGGTLPYSFKWSDNTAGEDLRNVTEGNYMVLIEDSKGCRDSANYMVREPAPLTIEADVQHVSCTNGSDGQITLMVHGGTSDYNYQWSVEAGSNVLGDLTAGTYSVMVRDTNNCQESASFLITEPTELTSDHSIEAITCFGRNDGSAQIIANGGFPPYIYSWSTGDTGSTLNNLSAGKYYVTITDNNYCEKEEVILIKQPQKINLYKNIAHTSCADNDGAIYITPYKGAAPYQFSWSNGDTVQNLLNISSGSYKVTVTDNNGCRVSEKTTVKTTDPVFARFTADKDTLILGIDDTIQFINNSFVADNFLWDFGDGKVSTEKAPVHIYADSGNYAVTLVAMKNKCSNDTATMLLRVIRPIFTGMEVISGDDLILAQEQNQLKITLRNSVIILNARNINLINSLGQIVRTLDSFSFPGQVLMNTSGLSSGIYFIRLQIGEKIITKKIWLSAIR